MTPLRMRSLQMFHKRISAVACNTLLSVYRESWESTVCLHSFQCLGLLLMFSCRFQISTLLYINGSNSQKLSRSYFSPKMKNKKLQKWHLFMAIKDFGFWCDLFSGTSLPKGIFLTNVKNKDQICYTLWSYYDGT